jgi:hypothetical protein
MCRTGRHVLACAQVAGHDVSLEPGQTKVGDLHVEVLVDLSNKTGGVVKREHRQIQI